MATGLVVLEKKSFERVFFIYMGMAAILAMIPIPFEQILNLLLPGCCLWNLIEIGPGILEEKSIEKVDDADDGRQITVYTINYPVAFGSGGLKIKYQQFKLFPCKAEFSMIFSRLININMPSIVSILIFISR